MLLPDRKILSDFDQAAEAHMSLGNVTSSRIHDRYFQQAIAYLRQAAAMADYTLPTHQQQYVPHTFTILTRLIKCRYLEEYSPLYPAA